MADKKIRKAHKRAFFWHGSVSAWSQHKATCPDCGGSAVAVRIESADESKGGE